MEPSPRTLVLSQGFEPVRVVSWQRALTLLFLGKVEVLEEYDRDVKATSIVIKIPAVVRLLRAFRRHPRPVRFSRINIYGRDEYRCQYCGIKGGVFDLTIDHILPRSRGGRTVAENLCAACFACNQRKGNRTPEEARMPLLTNPAALTYGIERASMCHAAESRTEWRKYLFLEETRVAGG